MHHVLLVEATTPALRSRRPAGQHVKEKPTLQLDCGYTIGVFFPSCVTGVVRVVRDIDVVQS